MKTKPFLLVLLPAFWLCVPAARANVALSSLDQSKPANVDNPKMGYTPEADCTDNTGCAYVQAVDDNVPDVAWELSVPPTTNCPRLTENAQTPLSGTPDVSDEEFDVLLPRIGNCPRPTKANWTCTSLPDITFGNNLGTVILSLVLFFFGFLLCRQFAAHLPHGGVRGGGGGDGDQDGGAGAIAVAETAIERAPSPPRFEHEHCRPSGGGDTGRTQVAYRGTSRQGDTARGAAAPRPGLPATNLRSRVANLGPRHDAALPVSRLGEAPAPGTSSNPAPPPTPASLAGVRAFPGGNTDATPTSASQRLRPRDKHGRFASGS